MLPKSIVKAGGGFIVFLIQGQVWVESEVSFQLFKELRRLSTGEQFLADWPNQLHHVGSYQASDFLSNRVRQGSLAPKELRPGTGVDNDSHVRLRRILL